MTWLSLAAQQHQSAADTGSAIGLAAGILLLLLLLSKKKK
jgi:hypothetical protein